MNKAVCGGVPHIFLEFSPPETWGRFSPNLTNAPCREVLEALGDAPRCDGSLKRFTGELTEGEGKWPDGFSCVRLLYPTQPTKKRGADTDVIIQNVCVWKKLLPNMILKRSFASYSSIDHFAG